jgi:uncharacterized surface protein with fasciclin (FAS1) repeats
MKSLVHAPKPLSRKGVLRSALLVPGMVLLGTACGDAPEASPRDSARGAPAQPRNSIVEVARAAGQFSNLLAAVNAAGLTETLEGDGPFTVFAPTDGAFANLPEGALDSLLDDPEALSQVLLYHVVPGRLTASEIREHSELETAQGETLRVAATAQGTTINDTYLLTADVPASNGIIHVITSVLLPDSD